MIPPRPDLPTALGTSGVRVRTLVAIRWMAIAGQTLTFAVVALVFGFEVPVVGVAAAIAASALLNIGLSAIYPRSARLLGAEALLHLAFDLSQLGVLLYLTGGLDNPFAVLLLVPVTISATLLSARATLALLAFALLIMAALWQWSLPLPWSGPPPTQPPLYELAMLISLALTLVFLALYVLRVSLDARRWQQALVTTQAVLERETKMSALGALAFGIDRDRRRADREVFQRAQRVHAVIGGRGHMAIAQQVMFESGGRA